MNFLENPHFWGLGWPQIRWMFVDSFHKGNYEPVHWLLMGIVYSLWELYPFGYHFLAVLLHSFNGVVLCWIFLQLLKLNKNVFSFSVRPYVFILGAGVSALFYSLHPLRIENVAWASGQHYVLSGFFYLLSIRFYLSRFTVENKTKSKIYYFSFYFDGVS